MQPDAPTPRPDPKAYSPPLVALGLQVELNRSGQRAVRMPYGHWPHGYSMQLQSLRATLRRKNPCDARSMLGAADRWAPNVFAGHAPSADGARGPARNDKR